MEMSTEEFQRIAREIESGESPVGIDARKTHVMILHRLETILERLERIEQRIGTDAAPRS